VSSIFSFPQHVRQIELSGPFVKIYLIMRRQQQLADIAPLLFRVRIARPFELGEDKSSMLTIHSDTPASSTRERRSNSASR